MDLWRWAFPTEPGTPFATPLLILLDSLRIFIIACTVVTVLLTPFAIHRAWAATQRYRLCCIGLLTLYVGLTEAQRFGDFANWRLILGAMCVVWAVISMVAFIQYEGDRSKPLLPWRKKR